MPSQDSIFENGSLLPCHVTGVALYVIKYHENAKTYHQRETRLRFHFLLLRQILHHHLRKYREIIHHLVG